MFVDAIDQHAAETILEHLEDSDATVRAAQLRVLGGAMARVPADATAFAHRGSKIMVNLTSFYQGPDDQPLRQSWVDRFAAALRQGDQGAYVGFLGDEGEDRVHQAYPPATWSGWPRSRPATTPATCSGATTTSRPPPERPSGGGGDAGGGLPGATAPRTPPPRR
jgi:hypothetical protein